MQHEQQQHRDLFGNPFKRWMPQVPDSASYSSAFGQTEWIEFSSILITICMNLTVALMCLFYFWSMRQHSPGHFAHKRARLPQRTPPDLPRGFLSWIRPLMSMPEQDVLHYAGFDAIVLLRFYKMAFKVRSCVLPLLCAQSLLCFDRANGSAKLSLFRLAIAAVIRSHNVR
jgi:Late exocytosis, associated with Golgi transport